MISTATIPTDRQAVVVEIEPLLVRSADAARLLGISARQFRRLDSAGAVPLAIRIGASKRFAVAELQAWIAHGCPSRHQFQALKKSRRLVQQRSGQDQKHHHHHERIPA